MQKSYKSQATLLIDEAGSRLKIYSHFVIFCIQLRITWASLAGTHLYQISIVSDFTSVCVSSP